jgi:hypothetical protein
MKKRAGSSFERVRTCFLVNRRHQRAQTRPGCHVIEYGRPARLLGCILLAAGGVALYAAVQLPPGPTNVALYAAAGMFATCVGLFLEFHFVRIESDGEFLYTSSPWRKQRVIPWRSVTRCDYSDFHRWHVLQTNQYGSVRLSRLLSGLEPISAQLRQRSIPSRI